MLSNKPLKAIVIFQNPTTSDKKNEKNDKAVIQRQKGISMFVNCWVIYLFLIFFFNRFDFFGIYINLI